jgi:hypothetical protein
MAHVTGDRVKDTTTTTGTGNITVSGSAPTGFRTLSAVATVDGDTLFIAIVGGSEWETSLATRVSANVYTRTTILASSNAGAAVNFSAGTKDVFITLPASKIADNTAYASSWDGDTATAPSKNAVYDVLASVIPAAPVAANWCLLDEDAAQSPNTTTGALSAIDRVIYAPFRLRRRITISDLGIFIGVGDAAKAFALAIYAHSYSTGRPSGTPLAATGDISTTSTNYQSADITGSNVTLDPGIYWTAIWGNTTTATYACYTTNQLNALSTIVGNSTLSSVLSNVVYSAESFNSAAWPNATSETYTVASGARSPILFAKAA